jgi:O-acetylhomoserine (thiol)-lyase
MNAFQILQGIETLSLRMDRHVSNALAVAEFLSTQPLVSKVSHPALASHPDYALAQQILPKGAGAVFSFDLSVDRATGRKFVEALKIFSHLANVGDAKSLVIHPASTTHFRMNSAALASAGIGEGTLRVSIGLEDVGDLIADLTQALKLISPKKALTNKSA